MAKKLLVADDSLTIQKVIKLALSGDGYEIQTVSDGTECLQQIALFRPDVVLIDIGLPGRSAFDIKKAANEDTDMSRIPFVLMSSAFEKIDEAKVALLRFDGRLTKPFDPSNLKDVLQQALKMHSGQGLKEFAPPPPPSGGFHFDSPAERSRQISRPPTPPSSSGQTSARIPMPASIGTRTLDNDITSEIRLADPAPNTFQLPESPLSEGGNDPLWNDSNSSTPDLDVRRSGEDADIRHLTESTVKMSGLDDLGGWNISENAKSSLPPIPEIFTNEPTRTTGTLSMSDIPMPSNPTGQGLDLELSEPTNFTNTSPYSGPGSILHTGSTSAPPKSPTPSAASNPANIGASHALPSQASLDAMIEKQVREQLEMIVQGAVKTQLEQMARKALPEIAERVVKQEIRKLLEGLASKE
jgi:CheY-like chemotaxis protein